MLFQQGDVLIHAVKKIPKGALRVNRQKRGLVLAQGEATGHAHVVKDEVEMLEKGRGLFIRSERAFTVVHEEHKPLTIPAGIWEVGKVREYDHFSRMATFVMD
jgi:hypothetical protein